MLASRKETLLTSLLWGGVAAVGQFTMLFLSIIGRIHVTFVDEAPVFSVDPRGPIVLTKDSALAAVWALSITYSIAVAVMVYVGHIRTRNARALIVISFLIVALCAGLAEPLWGLALLASLGALYPLLRRPAPATSDASVQKAGRPDHGRPAH